MASNIMPGAESQRHRLDAVVREANPPEVDAGMELSFVVEASCPSGCSLNGGRVSVRGGQEVVATSHLVTSDDGVGRACIVAPAPVALGEHTWDVVVAEHPTGAVVHDECCLSLTFRVRPHTTSIAVWDVPSPTVFGRPFAVKVGVKCSVNCQLAGAVVEVRDGRGAAIASARLGETPWPGTQHLNWAAVHLVAPCSNDTFTWSARFGGQQLRLPHADASGHLSFRTGMPPDKRVTVRAVSKDTGDVLDDVEVRLGLYEAFTNSMGLATIEVPAGMYQLAIRKDGFEAESRSVIVDDHMAVTVEANATLTKAEWEERLMRFEDYPWG